MGNHDISLFNIPNHTCIVKPKHCSEHGGLVTYLHESFTYEIYNFTKSILGNDNEKNIYLANIYRPPKENSNNEIIQQFITEISVVISEINKSNSVIIFTGDFNIDLLRTQQRSIFKDFLEMMVSFNLLPSLTLPTRISENSATIIDNVFSNYGYYGSYDAGIIITDISDHFPYFYSFNNNIFRNKFKKILQCRDFKKQNVDKMIQELESIDITQLLNSDLWSDPNTNYNILENLL